MQQGIHPEYTTTTIVCSCGNHIETKTTGGEEIHVEICSVCHPFYTGKQRLVDTAGRVERFKRKYGTSSGDEEGEEAEEATGESEAEDSAEVEAAAGTSDEEEVEAADASETEESEEAEESDETEAAKASS